MLSIFSCAFGPSVCLLWRNICLDLLPILLIGLFGPTQLIKGQVLQRNERGKQDGAARMRVQLESSLSLVHGELWSGNCTPERDPQPLQSMGQDSVPLSLLV